MNEETKKIIDRVIRDLTEEARVLKQYENAPAQIHGAKISWLAFELQKVIDEASN